MSIVKENSFLRVEALEINEDGKVSRKNMTVDRDSQLENTLLKADYPAYSGCHNRHPAAAARPIPAGDGRAFVGQENRVRRRGVLSCGRFGIRKEWQVLRR